MAHMGDPLGFEPSDAGPKEGRCLVVVLQGWLGNRSMMDDVVQAVRDAYGHLEKYSLEAGRSAILVAAVSA
ncbi:MAG: hypothetical protein ACR2KT_15305 [Methylocella sp.]